jgi:small subunit ribosomal protein S6
VNSYEVVYIFDTGVAEDRIQEKLTRFHELLHGEVTATDNWGRRQLAFPIKKKNAGTYVIVQFNAPQDALPEFERLLKLDDDLLRYLIVSHNGEPTAPMSIATREPRRDEDGEEGDEE